MDVLSGVGVGVGGGFSKQNAGYVENARIREWYNNYCLYYNDSHMDLFRSL